MIMSRSIIQFRQDIAHLDDTERTNADVGAVELFKTLLVWSKTDGVQANLLPVDTSRNGMNDSELRYSGRKRKLKVTLRR